VLRIKIKAKDSPRRNEEHEEKPQDQIGPGGNAPIDCLANSVRRQIAKHVFEPGFPFFRSSFVSFVPS
jgi:hypothetical protein